MSILEQNHGWTLLGAIPQFCELRVVLLLDTHKSCSILQKSFRAENVILDLILGVGIVEIDQYWDFFREKSQDFIHGVVLGLKRAGRAKARGWVCRRETLNRRDGCQECREN